MFFAILLGIIAELTAPAASPSVGICPTTEVQWTHTFRAQTPDSERFRNIGTVSAAALVTVNADGSVQSVALKKSSKYADVDAFTVSQAKNAIYKPKTINCKPVQGTYLFKITFAHID